MVSARLLCAVLRAYKEYIKELDFAGRYIYVTIEVPPDKLSLVRSLIECLRGA